MNDNLDEVILEYFREYRKKCQELKDLKDKLESANLAIKSLNETINSVTSEVFSMQHIITTMIDTGCDPVEAKLKYENNDSIWKDPNINGNFFTYPVDTSITAISLMPTTTTSVYRNINNKSYT